jgi:hypothetical protein
VLVKPVPTVGGPALKALDESPTAGDGASRKDLMAAVDGAMAACDGLATPA